MIPDRRWTDLLRDARQHLTDVQNLIALLERVAGSSAGALTRAKPSRTPPGGRARLVQDVAPLAGGGRVSGQRYAPPGGRSAVALLGTVDAVKAVLAQSGPLTPAGVLSRLTDIGWHADWTHLQRQQSVAPTMSQLFRRGQLRRRGAVYALAQPSDTAVRKLAAATARVDATPKPKPTAKPKPKRRRQIRSDRTLATRIVDELRARPNQTAVVLAKSLRAAGWRTSSADPTNVVRIQLSKLADGGGPVAVDRSGTHHAYRLRAPRAARKSTTTAKPHTTNDVAATLPAAALDLATTNLPATEH